MLEDTTDDRAEQENRQVGTVMPAHDDDLCLGGRRRIQWALDHWADGFG